MSRPGPRHDRREKMGRKDQEETVKVKTHARSHVQLCSAYYRGEAKTKWRAKCTLFLLFYSSVFVLAPVH